MAANGNVLIQISQFFIFSHFSKISGSEYAVLRKKLALTTVVLATCLVVFVYFFSHFSSRNVEKVVVEILSAEQQDLVFKIVDNETIRRILQEINQASKVGLYRVSGIQIFRIKVNQIYIVVLNDYRHFEIDNCQYSGNLEFLRPIWDEYCKKVIEK